MRPPSVPRPELFAKWVRLLFAKSASPHHGFAAFYTYLEFIFKAPFFGETFAPFVASLLLIVRPGVRSVLAPKNWLGDPTDPTAVAVFSYVD